MEKCVIEIRSGIGGTDASLFSQQLAKMYVKWFRHFNWEYTSLVSSDSLVSFEVEGKHCLSTLSKEIGIHRVTRIPVTETRGRVHTSTITVAVLPVLKKEKACLIESEIREDIFHAKGNGGQRINKVATAVRLTHVPTGIVVTCQDERFLGRNKEKAKSILLEKLQSRIDIVANIADNNGRRSQIRSGDRADKIRTYNFVTKSVIDHRLGKTLKLEEFLSGKEFF